MLAAFPDIWFDFWHRAQPSFQEILLLLPLSLLLIAGAIWLTSFSKRYYRLPTAYSRKIFHFIIFMIAAGYQLYAGLSAVIILGSLVALGIIILVVWFEDSMFYVALARPDDQPHATFFIIVPLLTTAGGGIITNLFFPAFAYMGYLISGCADAIAEPVGQRWGNHPYRVPSLLGVPAKRTWEGSMAVALTAAMLTLIGVGTVKGTTRLLFATGVVMGGTTLVEAISHHGLDNLTVQVVVAGILAAIY